MGVSIWIEPRHGKKIYITPGWRSMMWSLLVSNGLTGVVRGDDITALEHCRDNQKKGERDPPFDWSEDIAASFQKIIDVIKKDEWCIVDGQH